MALHPTQNPSGFQTFSSLGMDESSARGRSDTFRTLFSEYELWLSFKGNGIKVESDQVSVTNRDCYNASAIDLELNEVII